MYGKEKIIVTCGLYDPLTLEEINFIKKCRSKGQWLIVGIHSDWWMMWAQGGYVQNRETRREIMESIKYVDEIFNFNDTDGTVCQLLKLVKICYPHADITYISSEAINDRPENKIRGIKFETIR